MMAKVTIQFKNAAKFNPRNDFKHPTWFALSNSILEDPDYVDYSPLQFKALIYLFSQCSKKKWEPTEIIFRHAEKLHDIDAATLAWVLRDLEGRGTVTCLSPIPADETESVHVDVSTRTDICTGRTSTRSPICTSQTDIHTDIQTDSTDRHTTSCTVLALPAKPSPTELVDLKSEAEVLNAVPDKTKARWVALYPDADFLRREALKAFNWYENNPKKRPKTIRGWSAALSSWFERGWRYHVKTIEANAGSNLDWGQVFAKSGDLSL